MDNQKTFVRNWLLAAAVAGVLVRFAPGGVWAQYATDNNNGRALDANNRLGSDGVNDQRANTGGVSGNDIVYGNVTLGRQFRGTGASVDPRAFRGPLETPGDRANRNSGGSVYQPAGSYDPYTPKQYWGDSKGVAAPSGFLQLTPGSTGELPVSKSIFRPAGDLRLDATLPNTDLYNPRPGEFAQPGQVNLQGPQVVDPLGETQALGQAKNDAMTNRMPSRDLLRRLNMDESRIQQMRDELNSAAAQVDSQLPPDQVAAADLTNAAETPINDPLTTQIKSGVAIKAASGSVNTQQSVRQILLKPAGATARQSSQYAELQRRLDRFHQRQAMTDQQANQQFMKDWQDAQAAEKAAEEKKKGLIIKPGEKPVVKPGELPAKTEPDAMVLPGDRGRRGAVVKTQTDKTQGALPPQPDIPMKIASFADGVKAAGLKALLGDAEKAMHDGKFTQALDNYDAAAAVAPNNTIVLMGRTLAELGAGYYARAEVHLEMILSSDPALLLARYDLKAFYGEDRLQYIVRDLKDVAQNEPKQPRPLFLLAFIAYSTENEQRTADYLTMAEKRGGSKQYSDLLREYWKLLNVEKPLNK